MKTTVLINADLSLQHRELTDGFLASRNLKGDKYVTLSPSGSGMIPAMREVRRQLRNGDLLVAAEASLLGNTFSCVMRELLQLFEAGVGVGVAEADILFEGKGLKSREYAKVLAFVAELSKMMNSRKTRSALCLARQQGRRIGRPSGLGRLEGKEIEIKEYLNKRVSKSAIARILGISRASLAQFIASRQLEQKNAATGGASHDG